jgi:hypothetical protein
MATAGADPAADVKFRRLMLGLRRYLTGPRDGPLLRGVVRRGPGQTRAFIEPISPGQVVHPVLAVDLDHADGLPLVLTVLREVANKPYLPRILPPAPPDEFAGLAVNATAYLAWIGERATLTDDDLADAVLGDLVGDPAWHPADPGGRAVPGVVGYIRTEARRLRLYVARGDVTLGLDLALAGPSGRPGLARAWLATFDRGPGGAGTGGGPGFAARHGDSYCDHLVDLTGRG